jgi:hypothetical protein
MSDTTTGDTTEAQEEAPEVDELRQGWLGTMTEALGDAVVGSHIRTGRTLWVRVARDAWFDAA